MLVPGGSDVRDLVDRTDGVDDSSIAAALIWGDSVKHPGQEVGLSHLVVEGDRVHFRS